MIQTVSEEEINKQHEYMEKIKALGFSKKYFICTLGCKLNENDSEKNGIDGHQVWGTGGS